MAVAFQTYDLDTAAYFLSTFPNLYVAWTLCPHTGRYNVYEVR